MRAEPRRARRRAPRAQRRASGPGLISNSWGADRYDPALLDELFDARRHLRPGGHPQARRRGCTRSASSAWACRPEECVYVDDLAGNLKPARALGLTTLHHTDAAETVAALERLLGVPLRG